METWEPSAMNTLRPFHFHASGRPAWSCWAVRLAKRRSTAMGMRARALQ